MFSNKRSIVYLMILFTVILFLTNCGDGQKTKVYITTLTKEIGRCGSLEWTVCFELAEPSKNSGYIVQKVTTDFKNVTDCNGKALKGVPKSLTFYEAWEVKKDEKIPVYRSNDKKVKWDDRYKVSNKPLPAKPYELRGFSPGKGSWKISGEVKYVDINDFPDKKLPSDFIKGNKVTGDWTGNLPATTNYQKWWDPNNTSSHEAECTFKCCFNEKVENNFKFNPEDEPDPKAKKSY